MTHRRYVETARSLPAFFGFQADDRLYSGLSLTHANAQLITLGTALVNAIPCVLSRRFSASRACGTSPASTAAPTSPCSAA